MSHRAPDPRAPALVRHGLSLPPTPAPAQPAPPAPSAHAHVGQAAARQTVVRVQNLRSTPSDLLWNLFAHACSQLNLSPPAPLLPRPNPSNTTLQTMWAVFATPHDARASLSLSCDIYSVSPAPESDLALLPALRRLNSEPVDNARQRAPPPPDMQVYSHNIRAPLPLHPSRPLPPALTDASDNIQPYTMSTNPPNPKTSFRVGDWMCSSIHCGAHNFQRNTICIACGRGRAGGAPAPPTDPMLSPSFQVSYPSPRFATRFNNVQSAPHSPPSSAPPSAAAPRFPMQTASSALAAAQAQMPAKAPPPQYPPLTPSGRALSIGGRVRNISTDAMSPCVMYWPDNEPLPDKSQIRPIDSALITYPPIINTGNKGAAERQPGDWLCGKCNYHNWRRRKVCQTCFPYAEGNGDSISAAVQAERIALLANVLSNQFNALDLNGVPSQPSRPQVHMQAPPPTAPPYTSRFPQSTGPSRAPSPLLSPLSLSEQGKSPIYQTSAASGLGLGFGTPQDRSTQRAALLNALASSPQPPLLPSFLHDIVHANSSASSPPSSPSPDLTFEGSSEDTHYVLTPGTSHSTHAALPTTPNRVMGVPVRKGSTSSFSSLSRASGVTGSSSAGGIGSIWQFDGDETLSYSSSARTSPALSCAQVAARAPPRSDSPLSATSAVDSLVDDDTGTTPKGPGGFWKAPYAASSR